MLNLLKLRIYRENPIKKLRARVSFRNASGCQIFFYFTTHNRFSHVIFLTTLKKSNHVKNRISDFFYN